MKPWNVLDAHRGRLFEEKWPTLPVLFEITCAGFAERGCFSVFEPKELHFTYGEVHDAVVRVARRLLADGIVPGDRAAVSGKNSPEWAIAYLAVLYAGAVVVPIDYQLKDEEILGLLRLSGSKALFIDEERHDFCARGSLGTELSAIYSLAEGKPSYVLALDDERGRTTAFPVKRRSADLAAILYTSGTTGHAKGVMLTHENLVSDCFLSQDCLTVLSTDVFYALLPLHHSYTMQAVLIEALSTGAKVVFGKRMAVKQILSDLKQGEITMLLGIPMLFNKLLKGILKEIRARGPVVYAVVSLLMAISGFVKKTLRINPGRVIFGSLLKQASLDTVRICICGGGPLPAQTFKQFNQLGIDFVQGYGLTETSPIVTLNPVEHYKESSVGRIIPEVEIRISEPDERGVGEILVRGPIVMKGYFENPSATAEAFTPDGFLKTGDVGFVDHENYLYLTGRKKSLIVTEGGKNVFPEEIEDLFQLYDEIEQVMVRGYLKDPVMKIEAIEALIFPSQEGAGESVQSVRETADNQYVEQKIRRIVAEVNAKLLPYKRIERITILTEPLEMTTTRKIKRFKVSERVG
ncbi:MAG TPA: AMP-binding protein [Spirochaetia bacterium]|nr:AMP-binding protein [Spirochaetia bacterium]